MRSETYNHLEDMMGKAAAQELLDQEPAIKRIVDLASSKITAEVETNPDEQLIIKMSGMGHWRLTSISSTPDGSVYFTAQCIG